MSESLIRAEILRLADGHMTPYEIKTTTHGDELIPEFCPFCHGGTNQRDKKTFAVVAVSAE